MKNRTIFLAEDENIIALDLERILKRNGFNKLFTFNDGNLLLQKALVEQPDLIITDIYLKNNTLGTASAEKLWEKFNIPFIFISAFNLKPFKEKYDSSKCVFIKKPFQENQLLAAISGLLKNH